MQRLQELGYREGENLEFMYRSAEGRPELLASLAAELVNARPDVLISGSERCPQRQPRPLPARYRLCLQVLAIRLELD